MRSPKSRASSLLQTMVKVIFALFSSLLAAPSIDRNRRVPFALRCSQVEGGPPAPAPPPASVDSADNDEVRQMMGPAAPADKVAATLFASQSVAGASVFKLVRDLDDLSAALEQSVKDMKDFSERVREEKNRARRRNALSTASQVTPESREKEAAANDEKDDEEREEPEVD